MSKFVLYQGEVWKVIRGDHYGNSFYCLLDSVDRQKLRIGITQNCVPLDPALNVLFERKENE